MKNYNKKSLSVRIFTIFCSAMLLFLSPCAQYMEAVSIDVVYATEMVVSEAAVVAVEWLVAALATIGLYGAAYDNREAIAESYGKYLKSRKGLGNYTASDCIQILDTAGKTTKVISWDDLIDSLGEYHDTAVDKLTGIYVKYCPQLLGESDNFVMDVLEGDVYVAGVSDAVVDCDTVSLADIEQQWSGASYFYQADFDASYRVLKGFYTGSMYRVFSHYTADYTAPMCGRYWREGSWHFLRVMRLVNNKWGNASNMTFELSCYRDGNLVQHEIHDKDSSWSFFEDSSNQADLSLSWSANFPVFSEYEDAENYLKGTGSVTNALNYSKSVDDSITDNNDLPPFYRPWQQELWDRVAEAPDIGIGSYGDGADELEWADDIPWIDLDSLSEYADSIQDVYEKNIDDIINGLYDKSEDIPDTYGDAWEAATEETWEDKVDLEEGTPSGEGGKEPGEDEKEPEEGGDDSDVNDIINRIPSDLKEVGKCDKFAQSLVNALDEEGISYQIIRVDSEFEVYSDKAAMSLGKGFHYGVQVGDMVYDNMTLDGMELSAWLEDLGLMQEYNPMSWHYTDIIIYK